MIYIHLCVSFFFFKITRPPPTSPLSPNPPLSLPPVQPMGLEPPLPVVEAGPVDAAAPARLGDVAQPLGQLQHRQAPVRQDRKSTRLNSSHANISYAVFCLKKKKTKNNRLKNKA